MIRVGLSQGDTNGVGYEVIWKAFADPRMLEFCIPILYGSQKFASYYRKIIESSEMPLPDMQVIHDPQKAIPGKLNLIRCVDDSMPVEPGALTDAGGKAAFQSLQAVVSDIKKGTINALLTAPINKRTIQNPSFHFPGHTEFLEDHFGMNERQSLMILLSDRIRIALTTGHIPLSKVKETLTTEGILEKLTLFDRSLREDFGIERPRIAVFSLNPHAGDDGLTGDEEATVIRPALDEASRNGMLVFGPYPADGFFGARTYNLYDGILAMYHDQGLAPFKALAMDSGVNYTAGLSIVRTSPAHGTAFDIAGKNEASPASLRHALYTLLDVYRNRKRHQAAIANPLRKQYVDKSGDKEKLDLSGDS